MSLWSKPAPAVGTSGRTALLERLFEHVPVGLLLSQRGVVVSANPAFAKLFGVAVVELAGRPLQSLFLVDGAAAPLPKTGSVTYQVQVRRGGREAALGITITALDSEGTHAISARDLSRERESERELVNQREFLRKLIDTVPGFVFVKDWDSRFLLANRALAEAYGTTTANITGKSDADFNSDADEIEHFRNDDREVISSRRPKLILSEKVTHASGHVRWLTTVKVPIVDDLGNCSSLLAVATDITELKESQEAQVRLQERMLEAQKLESLGVLAGGIAHDFNNLLLAMLGSAEAALLQIASESPLGESIQRIRKAALRAAELTNQLLAYSGKGQFVVQTVDLNALVRDMVELLEVTTGRRATLEYAFAAELPGVTGDVSQLRQVVMNLITNAVDAIGEHSGVVKLQTGVRRLDDGELSAPEGPLEQGEYVFLRVSDSGCGMDAATVGKIFEPFFTTKFAGRGLGLAAVLGIVRSHRGAITVESRPGEGSVFTVYFPASDQAPRVPSRRVFSAGSSPQAGARTVLVVDDETLICFTTKQLLELLGYRVLTAADGSEALELFEREGGNVDAVLLDLTMPIMPADEVLSALRARHSTIKVLLMSGYDEQEIQNRMGTSAIDGFLQKPFTLEQLNSALQVAFQPPPEAES